jgi:predicted AAA+ superfamily ATPase
VGRGNGKREGAGMLSEVFRLSRFFIRKYNREYIRFFLKKYELSNRFSIVTGQRGVGKSTAIIQHLLSFAKLDPDSDEILYVPVDHVVIAKYSLYEIAEEFVNTGGKLICFDEIHKCADWSQQLKSIYDTFPQLIIIASGSSALEIHKGSHDLSRRAIIYKMPGMSFREFIEIKTGVVSDVVSLPEIIAHHPKLASAIIAKVEKRGKQILPLFFEYLKFGYYPYFLEFPNLDHFKITLEQNLHTAVELDLLAVYPTLTGGSARKIKKLLSYIAASVPFTPDLHELKEITAVGDNRTLKTYLKYLEDAGIILQFEKAGKPFASLKKPEKIYLNNSNQMFALAGGEDRSRGTMRETFFANILAEGHEIHIPKRGDFLIDHKWTFEVGGKNKQAKQIKGIQDAFLAIDGIEQGFREIIPLWLFGFVY